MEIEKIIEKFFPNNKENILSKIEVDSEKLFKIDFKENELRTNLPFMNHLYIVDNEGYFRGLITLGGYKRTPNYPHFTSDNLGKIKLWYCEIPDSDEVVLFKKGQGLCFTPDRRIPLTEGVDYILENTEQIKKPEYKIRKEIQTDAAR